MPFIVTEPCIQCKYTDCVAVCPMDCFVAGPNFLVIDPDGCIDCSVCVPECPVNAIVNAADATEAQRPYIALNARLAKSGHWPPIRRVQPPLPDHAAWRDVAAKVHLLVLPDLQAE
ncbi:ferredoxin FdxA [Rhodoferax sp.]|uniref:ferredoxin FdxA n=1 Tax=Rhodoferax sp. TaxID=50421 RepID=UPI0025D7409A|nr:ferredoxin FdxA [Rhodoferax sp.]